MEFIKVMLLFFFLHAACAIAQDLDFKETQNSAKRFEQSAESISKVLTAVLKKAEPETKLIPDHFFPPGTDPSGRVNKNRYSPHNSGADLYPFLIITSSFIAPEIYQTTMLEMLRNEIKYTNVKDGVPGTFDLTTKKVGRISLFSGAEYMKDGVVPVTEFLGKTPWFDRMEEIAKGIMHNGTTKSKFGLLPSNDSELNGDMLQVFARLIPMTANPNYLEWSRRIADAYIDEAIPGSNGLVPTKWDFSKHKGNALLRLRDHGNETLVGLVASAAIEKELQSDRAARYIDTVRTMIDRTLQSANKDGLLYNVIHADTLAPETDQLADNWGYVYGAVYSFYMLSAETKYRDATLNVLNKISNYKNYPWEGEHYDGIADSVESALYLLAREPVESGFDFVEHEINRMYAMQRADGHIDQSYLEGNYNRTAIMYMMYKSQGILPAKWEKGLGIGGKKSDNGLKFTISSSGKNKSKFKIKFDSERHRRFLNFTKNYPRVNEFPEWFVVKENQLYLLKRQGETEAKLRLGSELIEGIELSQGDYILSPN